jgi:hypothetical protein
VLVAGGLSELQLQFCPLTTGRLDVRINVVDCDTRELVSALLVAADAQTPLVTRSFEVGLRTPTLSAGMIHEQYIAATAILRGKLPPYHSNAGARSHCVTSHKTAK